MFGMRLGIVKRLLIVTKSNGLQDLLDMESYGFAPDSKYIWLIQGDLLMRIAEKLGSKIYTVFFTQHSLRSNAIT